jgi:ribonuclease HI
VAVWLLRFDGLYEPRYTDHGIATYGIVIDHGRRRMHEGHGVVVGPGLGGDANVAEFGALIHGLTWLAQNVADEVRDCGLTVEGDNRLAIETVAGRWDLHNEKLLPLRDRARHLVAELGGPDNVTLTKVSRERNAEPDALTRRAYHEAKLEHPEWIKRKGSATRTTPSPTKKPEGTKRSALPMRKPKAAPRKAAGGKR